MKKYLYHLYFEADTVEEGYCLSNKDLSEDDIKPEDEDNRFEAFGEMIDSNFIFNEGSAGISHLEIMDKLECSFAYNKYLPDNLYLSLLWFNQAMKLYDNAFASQDDLKKSLQKIRPIDCLRLNVVPDSYTLGENVIESESLELLLKESLIIRVAGNYLQYRDKRIRYAEIILREIVKLLDYNSLSMFDSYMKDVIQTNVKRRSNGELLHLQEGKQLSIYDLKHNILYYAERLVLEIKYIMGELRDVIRYWGDDTLFQSATLYLYDSFKDAILNFKRRLILERMHIEIEHKEIPVTLGNIVKEKDLALNKSDRAFVFKELCPLYKNEKKAKRILDDMDKFHNISVTPKFPKRQLGVLIYVLFHCDCFDKNLSFESFKQKICAYYGKDDISIKPNKVRQEAMIEYQNRDFLYKEWGLTLSDLK